MKFPNQAELILALRLAFRELRGGFRGFYVFVACIALGVASIVAVGALADAFENGVSQKGREILGGDVALSRNHQKAEEEIRTALARYGSVSEVATMRAMVRTTDGNANALVEVKAVDEHYPHFGTLRIQEKVSTSLSEGAIAFADPLLFDRLGLRSGDKVQLGTSTITLLANIQEEPDRLSSGNAFGPRLMLSVRTLEASGLVQPGSLIRWFYRIKISEPAAWNDDALRSVSRELKEKFADKGFYVNDRLNPTPEISTAISRLGKFLTLVGLTALIIGGVGVANAVYTFIENKRATIATFKCLGASNGLIFKVYLFQILMISATGIGIGAVCGLIAPIVIGMMYGSSLPIELNFAPQMETVAVGVLYGFLVSLLFVVLPLRRSREVRPQMLFREIVTGSNAGISRGDIVVGVLLGGVLIAAAITVSRAEMFSLYFCGGLAVIFVVFILYGGMVQKLAQRLPRLKGAALVVARANIAGPGSYARTIILSLGLGLSLLVTVANIDVSMVQQLKSGLPDKAPSHFFLDIKRDQFAKFEELVKVSAPRAKLSNAPMLRGRIVKLAGVTSADIKAPPNAQWVLRGDRGITYSDILPDGSKLTEGEWWGKDHRGSNLVSFEAEIGKALGLKIGDEVVVSVLGREISARIANFRSVKWESLSINFVMVFSPNTLAGAPVNILATLHPGNGHAIEGEGEFLRKLSKDFPNVTAIRVRDAIEAVSNIYQRIMAAIRVAGGLTLVAGALVLAGALATAHRRRIYESAIFKTLGATKLQIISAHVLEYLGLSLITSVLAVLLGSVAAWAVLVYILDVEFVFSLYASTQVVAFSVILVLIFGMIGSWRVLSAKTAPYLRGR